MKKQKAFTLVELLVVISIIAMLLSIMMPALRKVRGQAHSVVCRSNLKQIVLAASLWSQDNDGWSLPESWHFAAEHDSPGMLGYFLAMSDDDDGSPLAMEVAEDR